MPRKTILDEVAYTKNRDRQASTEARARLAYQVWAHRAGLRMAFEDLTQHQMDGWRGVVKALEQHPRCWKCGAELICLRCKEEEKADPCWERP